MRFPIVLTLLVAAAPLAAQNPPAAPPTPSLPGATKPAAPAQAAPAFPTPVTDDGIWQPIVLATPNDRHQANGAPGKGYWQQQVPAHWPAP
jgi:hypothetical protein